MSRWEALRERLYPEGQLNNRCWVPDSIHFSRSECLSPANRSPDSRFIEPTVTTQKMRSSWQARLF